VPPSLTPSSAAVMKE